MTSTLHALILIVVFVILAAGGTSYGQANLPVYTDHLVNGFQNWSWAAVNPANASPVYTGSDSLSVTDGANYQALYLEHTPFNTTPYASLDFWINGGASGGQKLQVVGLLSGNSMFDYPLVLETNAWQHINIPLSNLGVADATNCTGFWIQGAEYAGQPVYYVDNMQLVAAPAPAPVHLSVDAGNVVRTADTRWFGLNTAVWDGSFNTVANLNELKKSGCTTFRYPGGSLSDIYNWATGESIGHDNGWAMSFADFMPIATNLGAQVFITVNYGTGTPNEAAAWVASANVTNHCNFKYWEIGNEVYGKWEADSNSLPHDPVTYATRAAGYIAAMKAVDPTIKIGVVAVPGEDDNINYPAEVVTNPVTGQIHSGWTPVVLATFKNLGVNPDFLIYHYYPEYTSGGSNSSASDPLLLQVAGNHCPATFSDWASASANLRMQITDYLGAPGTNIELCVTENEGDSGAQGKQSTSIVSALYEADSLGQLMQTEFNSLVWWDLRNGPDTGGDFDSTLYGWRAFGDYGVMHGTTTIYPAYYAQKLLQYFVRGGDSIVGASSDYLLLSDYAARRTNGALTLLVINKDLTTSFNAQIVLTNFLPWSNATIQSYGIAQDTAAETHAPAPLQDIAETTFPGATTNFNYSFPPGTLTLFTFTPAATKQQASLASANQLALKFRGRP